MVAVLFALVMVLTILAVWTGFYALKIKAERHERGLFGPWPIRKVRLDEFDTVFRPGLYGAGLESEVLFLGRGPVPAAGATSDTEAWVLAVLAKRARAMFEFGTASGRTTYLWARNAPPGAEVVTITLPPEQLSRYTADRCDRSRDVRTARRESKFTEFLYSGTPVESRIAQLFGDSKEFDETPYEGRFDLIFVDGSHAHSYVRSDSRKALRMCAPGGIILWHDYRGPRRSGGVFRALNELARELPLVHLAGTTFVAYRKPAT